MVSVLAAASAAATSAAAHTQPSQYRAVGVVLAIGSGVLIGSSFVFKKKGLIASQSGHEAGEGVAYLKSPLWWTGMTMMIVGELCNFGAYAFVEAIIVTPMGALSVVICAILSSIFLKEKLSLFGWIGCIQCILGSVIIALNGPEEQSVSTIAEFKKLFLAPGFLAYGSVVIASALGIIFFIAPKYGKKNMIWYILVCSLIGGLSVSCTQGLGASIVTTIRGQNQFKNWFIYFLIGFVTITLVTEIYFLNVALALFNTAMVTPTYYVIFTFCTLVTSIILYQGLKASAAQIITVVLGFLTICLGIILLQMSKIDPRHLTKLDRKTTILLQAAREEVAPDADPNAENDLEKGDLELKEEVAARTEEPGMDALRGTFGAVGTIIRARRKSTVFGEVQAARARRGTVSSVGSGYGHVNGLGRYGTGITTAANGWVPGERKVGLADAPVAPILNIPGYNDMGDGTEEDPSVHTLLRQQEAQALADSQGRSASPSQPQLHIAPNAIGHPVYGPRLVASPTAGLESSTSLARTRSIRFDEEGEKARKTEKEKEKEAAKGLSPPIDAHFPSPQSPPIPPLQLRRSTESAEGSTVGRGNGDHDGTIKPPGPSSTP